MKKYKNDTKKKRKVLANTNQKQRIKKKNYLKSEETCLE